MLSGANTSRAQKASNPLAGNHLQRMAQQDKARIGVLGTASRRRFERQAEAGVEQFVRVSRSGEETDVAGQARSVREQHAQRHLVTCAAGGFALCKSGKNLRQGLFEEELPTLVEEHGHGGGGEHLGDAGQVVDGGRADRSVG